MLSSLDNSLRPRISPLTPVIGQWLEEKSTPAKVVAMLLGIALISILAQIAIPLPYTPVPITGQTFGVALVSLLLGRKWGFSTVALYVSLGSVGLPIFAQARAGLQLVSAGYLVGMCVGSFVIGTLADRGWSRSFGKAFAACLLGSICVFSLGLLGLVNFVPTGTLLAKGLLPFVPGDLAKSALAAALSARANRAA